MEAFITVIAFLGVLVVLIIAHEFGHYITAKASGVTVEEVGIGFPPRLLSLKRGGTIYSLNAIPLGGFVKMAGEEDPKVAGSLASKSIPVRLLAFSAGSLMNLLLPLLLFSVAFMVPHNIVYGQVQVDEVSANSPAARAGIVTGDTILEVNGQKVNNIGDLQRPVQLNLGREIAVLVEHADASTEEVRVVPRWQPPEGEGAIGVAVRMVSPTVVRQSYPFWRAIPMGVRECIDTFVLFKNGIIGLIIGSVPRIVAGPVGIAQITGEVAQAGLSPLLEFAAFLSINLAIINLLPLPALDGGRIAFVFLEWVRRGRRVPARIEGMIHMAGFALLITFILLVTYQDIIRIVSGESLLP
ncbi:MAG: RIP metalloprotease RseP [Chloroflexi bacterium]|nr:RIP metalloprotease RseP [Chloroflexota bacterium]